MISTTYFKISKTFIFLLLLVAINGCKTLKPAKPEEAYSDVAKTKNLSTVNIPIEFPLSELENQINKQIKGLIYEDNGDKQSKNENLKFKVWKREEIQVKGEDDKFHITVPLKVWVKADLGLQQMGLNVSGSKDTDFEIDLNFISGLSVNSDYKVVTDIKANGYEWIRRPKIKMGFFDISLGSFVEPYINEAQEQISKNINQQIQDKIDIKKWVQKAWTTLQQPILISEEYKAWLNIVPTEIHMTPLKVNNESASAIIGFEAFTETVFGEKPIKRAGLELPTLNVAESVEDDFALIFSGEIKQERAREILSEKLVGKNFKKGKRNVTITGIDLYGSGEDLIVEADLKGSINGKVYLTGKPHYDPVTQSLVVRDLDYTLDTKSKLAKTANWLVKGRMVKNLEESFQIPLETQLTKARSAIEKRLQSKPLAKGVVLSGTLKDISPSEVYMTEDSIGALVKATGSAEIKINGL